MTVIGVDAHKRTHTLVAVDDGGRKLGEKTVPSTTGGHADAIQWALANYGAQVVWAIEDNRSMTSLLEHDLLAAGTWRVARCPPHLMARSRSSARTVGKSDPIDALAVARAALHEPDLPAAFHDPVSWELRQLRRATRGPHHPTRRRDEPHLRARAPPRPVAAHPAETGSACPARGPRSRLA